MGILTEFINFLKTKRLLKSIKKKNAKHYIIELTKPIGEIDDQIIQEMKEYWNKVEEEKIRISIKL
jgi:hypothetical protein